MRQHEAVVRVMEQNGGFATLAHLYQHVFSLKGCDWKTKTPQASVRRIVQDPRFFFKIRPGLWALNNHRADVLRKLNLASSGKKDQADFTHSYVQGLLVETGNMREFATYVPMQDKNKPFLDKRLKDIASLDAIQPFAYSNILRHAKTVDVIWFNDRQMPDSMFEVEHTTGFQNSLIKFVELIDFATKFYIVSDEVRKNEFEDKLSRSAFKDISSRVSFLDYEKVSNLHLHAAVEW